MNKSPIKQIYLLLVIIGGFVSLSIYSTYALFTYEQTTIDVASISTLNSLSIDSSLDEYKRIKLGANAFVTIDVDISNAIDDDLCYGIWYKVMGDYSNVYLYKTSNDSITSGSILGVESKRVSIIAINNNNIDVYVNIGVKSGDNDNCSLNLNASENLISDIYEKTYLNDYFLGRILDEEIIKGSEYKKLDDYLLKLDDSKLLVSSEFEFTDSIFTLVNPYDVDIKDINVNDNSYYFMLDNEHEMYKINSINDLELKVTKYVGFVSSINGVLKYENNYVYYGANPDNYICFNNSVNDCELFRIIGLFYDGENNKYNMKIVKNDYIGKFLYSENNNLFIDEDVNSNIYDILVKYYDDKFSELDTSLVENARNMVEEYSYKIDYNDDMDNILLDIYNYNSVNNYKLKVGMLSLTDYLYASNCNDRKVNQYDRNCFVNDWLYKYDEEMLINRVDNDSEKIYAVSDKILKVSYDTILNVRPVVYLKDDVMLIRGDGGINNPFVIR